MFAGDAWSVMFGALLKLGIAALLGGLIGWERETHGRPAGMRTHMMTVIGVVLFSEVSKHFAGGDPTRIAAQIVTGIGFLGAGTILRHGPEIRGLTTAASLWAAAGIGMAVSTGGIYIVIAVAATLLALFTLAVVERFEQRVNPGEHGQVLAVVVGEAASAAELFEALTRAGAVIRSSRVVGEEPRTLHIRLSGDRAKVLAAAKGAEGVVRARWEDVRPEGEG